MSEFNYIPNATPEGTTFRVIVCGGRDFRDWNFFCAQMDSALKRKLAEGRTIEIVHGDCLHWLNNQEILNTDQMADRYGKEKGYIVTPVRAHWQRHQKRAGPIRNAMMRDYGHVLIAFWNNKSSGTRNMIRLAKKKPMLVHIVWSEY
jgi:hypothetical protein